MAFIRAWAADDHATLAALSTDGITCRWTGFGSDPVEVHGLDELVRQGRELERLRVPVAHLTVVEPLGGERHAAVLFQQNGRSPDQDHVARIAVYRLDGDRIASIAVYGDRLD